MPCYDFACENCDLVKEDVIVKDIKEKVLCSECDKPMKKLFPISVHTKVGNALDGADIGRKVREKNEKLKKREAGYSHDDKNLRRDITKRLEESKKQ